MLEPHDRTSLSEALRPPPGFSLDAAVGTSFTLDLEALLTAPIAFALHDASEADADPDATEPVALLEAIRRHADRITLFCQRGQIAVPTRRRTVFAWLEDTVVEVAAEAPNRAFHPKVWVTRFRAFDDDTFVLRVLCATRNLTHDTSWDTLLRLESEPFASTPDSPPIEDHRELVELVRELPRLAGHPLSRSRLEQVAGLADDLERVALVVPKPFDRLRFHVFGIGADRQLPVPEASTAALVVSPFLSQGLLSSLTHAVPVKTLVSREDALDRIPAATLERIDHVAVLNSSIDVEPADSPVDGDGAESESLLPGQRLSGLHAKLFVFDTRDGPRWLTGSANATNAAFSGNVEVLAELSAPRSATSVTVDAVLADTPGETGLTDLLLDYRPSESPLDDSEIEVLHHRLGELCGELASAGFRATVTPADDEFRLNVTTAVELQLVHPDLEGVEVTIWPVTLDEMSSAQHLEPVGPVDVVFPVTLEGISSFLALRIAATHGRATGSVTLLVNAALAGAPSDRQSLLLANMLRDKDRLLRYLLLLLDDPGASDHDSYRGQGAGWLGRFADSSWDQLPLLELLLRALDRNPSQLDHIDRLLDHLGDQRDELLPIDFDTIWSPIWQQRQDERT